MLLTCHEADVQLAPRGRKTLALSRSITNVAVESPQLFKQPHDGMCLPRGERLKRCSGYIGRRRDCGHRRPPARVGECDSHQGR
jgi:hypothetical protein